MLLKGLADYSRSQENLEVVCRLLKGLVRSLENVKVDLQVVEESCEAI